MPRSSPRILDCRWGRVSIDGHGAVKDAKLYPGGARAWDWGETGRRAVQPMISIQIVGSPRDRVGSGRFACGAEDGMAATKRAAAETIEQRVVDAALAIAGEVGWEQVRLSTIADRTELPLAEIGRHFRDVDAIANAWFARARLAMLALPAEELAGRLGGRADRAGLRRLARQPGPASPGRGRDPAPQALSLPSAPLGAAGLRPVAVGARSIGRGAGARFWPAAAGPGDRPDRDHPYHLGGMAPGRQSRTRSAASDASGSDWPAPDVSPGGCGRRRSRLVPPRPQNQLRQASRPLPRRAVDVEALLQRDLRHQQEDRHGGPARANLAFVGDRLSYSFAELMTYGPHKLWWMLTRELWTQWAWDHLPEARLPYDRRGGRALLGVRRPRAIVIQRLRRARQCCRRHRRRAASRPAEARARPAGRKLRPSRVRDEAGQEVLGRSAGWPPSNGTNTTL